jgi:hypothetical protein
MGPMSRAVEEANRRLLRIRPGLTLLAAAALTALALCATVYQFAAGQTGSALFALAIALLSGLVAYGRWRVAPLGAATALQAA